MATMIATTASTARVIFTHDHGAFPDALPVTPLTMKRYGVPP
jgi:hypothetical protein